MKSYSLQQVGARLAGAVVLLALAASASGGIRLDQYTQAQVFDVPYVPTPDDVVQRMLELAEVQPDDYLVDLGSGDGRIVIAAVQDFGVEQAKGIDIDPRRIEEAKANAEQAGVADRAQFEHGDIFDLNFTDADVLTLYLLPDVNDRLRPVILEQMAPGTRVVSHAFDMRDWEPDHREDVNGREVFLWIVPAQVEGEWRITAPDEQQAQDVVVTFNQRYQELGGHALVDGQAVFLEDAGLEGEEIRFTIGDDSYVGRVQGDTIQGISGDSDQEWHAERI